MKKYFKETPKKITINLVIIVLLLLFLAILLSYTLKLNTELKYYKKASNIVGTYMANTPETGDAEYLTFIDDNGDNTYFKYKQFQILEKGNYISEDTDIFTLENNSSRTQIVYKKNIYIYDSLKKEYLVYVKISDNPIFINIEDPTN